MTQYWSNSARVGTAGSSVVAVCEATSETGAGGWAGGVVGQSGTLRYAIQGNVLTGQPVVTEAELAIQNTPGTLADKLMADGLSPDMSVAVIENGARPEMRVLRGLLAGLPDLVEHEGVVSPALIVIGEVTARTDAQLAATAMEAAQ